MKSIQLAETKTKVDSNSRFALSRLTNDQATRVNDRLQKMEEDKDVHGFSNHTNTYGSIDSVPAN